MRRADRIEAKQARLRNQRLEGLRLQAAVANLAILIGKEAPIPPGEDCPPRAERRL